jgi:pimeloyl-ACP methyl ester carboxylesterase
VSPRPGPHQLPFALLGLLGVVASCDPGQPGSDPCSQAADQIEACTGHRPALPAEGCVGAYLDSAAAALDRDCDQLAGGKADDGGFWCQPVNRWMGRCSDQIALSDAAAIAGLDDACPVGRRGSICDGLRTARSLSPDHAAPFYAEVRDAIRAQVARDPASAIADPAIRYYLRERAVGLLVYQVIGATERPADYRARADQVLRTHLPAYPADQFHLARTWLPPRPASACDQPQLLVWFPGVMRLTRRDEWIDQWRAIQDALPCAKVLRVDAGSFMAPEVNAAQAWSAIRAADLTFGPDTPIHLMGYSQGARNALETLLRYPDIAARTRSVITLSSAARGSEVGDLLYRAMQLGAHLCDDAPAWLQPTCDWAAERSPRPHDLILGLIARAMGVTTAELADFVDAEDAVDRAGTIREMFERHLDGVRSLTTGAAAEFWNGRARQLPTDVLYLEFRSVISRPDDNLPGSNRLFYELLERAGGDLPWNDMQVRLPNQRLAGPVAGSEVAMPVCEGNHWQWVLADDAVPDALMPGEMARKTPHRALLVAYYQTLLDIDLL